MSVETNIVINKEEEAVWSLTRSKRPQSMQEAVKHAGGNGDICRRKQSISKPDLNPSHLRLSVRALFSHSFLF
jgi:hypothetical protein